MSSPQPPFYVSCSDANWEPIRRWYQRAVARGLGDEFQTAVREMYRRLSADPETFGDPLYPYRDVNWTVYHGMSDMLRVHYAVDPVRRIVYVKQFLLVPWHPLHECF